MCVHSLGTNDNPGFSAILVNNYTFTPLGDSFSPSSVKLQIRESAVVTRSDFLFPHMFAQRSPLGSCPFCGEEIPHGNILIEYEGGLFAECLECGVPVEPE